jgi:hypothetical protein
MRAVTPLLLLVGCERDPTFFGIWDIVEIERDGEAQQDMGFLEVMGDGKVSMLLRYTWGGGDFHPEPHPDVIHGSTSQTANFDFVETYHQKGETYTLMISPFGDNPFGVDRYTGDKATLTSAEAAWPDLATELPGTELLPMVLYLQR